MTDSFPAHTALLKCVVLQSLFTCALFAALTFTGKEIGQIGKAYHISIVTAGWRR